MESEVKDENAVENVYRQEFELLKGMFEDHFSSDVIAGVLEDCAGDVNHAVDTLTKISSSVAVDRPVENPPSIESRSSTVDRPVEHTPSIESLSSAVTECHRNNTAQTSVDMSCTMHSYASASQATTKAPRIIQPRRKNVMPKIDYWTEQIRKIIKDYNEGSRVMIIMRGAPGSGKSYLARVIIESTVGTKNFNNYANHIYSADDHMVINGIYSYNINRLDEVHMKNQSRVHKAVNEGRSPVIVDNTNMKTWEMFAYARDAVANGYIIEVLEPSNPWSRNPSQLAKRNIHGVPKEKIQIMFQKYEGSHTGESLIKYFKLVYPKGMVPPVKRNIPPFLVRSPILILPPRNIPYVTEAVVNQSNHIHENNNLESQQRDFQEVQHNNHNINEIPVTLSVNDVSQIVESNSSDNQTLTQRHQINDENNMDEILKVEVEWENGDVWESPLANRETKVDIASSASPKPQRSKANALTAELEKYIEPSMLHDDWSKNLKFMTPMQDTASALEEPLIQLQTATTSIPVESGFFVNDEQITTSTIQGDVTPKQNKITIKQESSMTGRGRCEHEEKHFIQMRKMFKNVPRPVLREIFDNCAGDVYWACSIVLDGIKHNNLETVNGQESDSEEEEEVDCQCQNNQARFSLMPDTPPTTLLSTPDENVASISTPLIPKKTKKEKIATDGSIQLKRQIEKTIMISDDHYSQHYLNMRRPRQDNKSPDSEKATSINNESPSNNQTIIPEADLIDLTSVQSSSTPLANANSERCVSPNASQNVLRDMPSTSFASAEDAVPSTSGTVKFESIDADDEDDDDYDIDYVSQGCDNDKPIQIENKNVTLNIGMEFVRRLDELYGRHDFEYPEGVEAVMSIPTKILHELNAFWMESITYQLDNNHTQTEEMIKQDEEFARQVELELQLEEEAESENSSEDEENAQSCEPQKPSEPNFKEIMDTELALAIYEKEVKEKWKIKEPQDMAGQMTRKKLYELFPDVANETLSEMLIAHDNSFDNTVETLLMSTGQGHYLDQTNGINKFVMEKEKENKDKLMLAEQNAALNEEEYPYLFKPGKEQTELSMDTVNQMRQKAEMHKNARDMYFQKAQWYYARKKLAEASHYSRIAALHTSRYDTANNYAAAALVQYHAHFHPEANVIDLHFLRVPEAETSLDLFIDDRLRKMRLSPNPKPLVLHIITGRGKHSPGRPRVKPAIMNRLRIRGLSYRHQNPGLLEARLHPTHMLLEELLNS